MVDTASLAAAVGAAVERHALSGVAAVYRGGERVAVFAGGLADRRWGVANTADTRFQLASGTKGFTALAVLSLVADGTLALDQPVRSLLGDDLPLIDDRVTIAHLLAHRSGIGDYLDEDQLGDVSDYVMPVPVHRLDSAAAYLEVLDGHPQVSEPGERFAYNNSGYVVLAVAAERAEGVPLAQLVAERVGAPAGLTATGFERNDALPGDLAAGYLDPHGLRTNVLHLPVLGGGDGGIASTVDDVDRLWTAVLHGSVVPNELVTAMTSPHSASSSGGRYGLGVWLAPSSDVLALEGMDAGISFRSLHVPDQGVTATVVSNTSRGAWPVAEVIDDVLWH